MTDIAKNWAQCDGYRKELVASFGEVEVSRREHKELLERTDREEPVYMAQEYIVDGLMPTGEIHVLVGPSGSGKSTFLYKNFIHEWQHNKKVFGRDSTFMPYMIFSADRSLGNIQRSLQRMKLNPKPSVNTQKRPCKIT